MITRRLKHKKRGNSYRVLPEASFQVSVSNEIDHMGIYRRIHDGEPVIDYQREDDRKIYVRFPDEIDDKERFEELPPLDDEKPISFSQLQSHFLAQKFYNFARELDALPASAENTALLTKFQTLRQQVEDEINGQRMVRRELDYAIWAVEVLNDLAQQGGCIVSSGVASEMEITDAKVRGDFYVDPSGFGYIRRSKEWLARVHARDSYMQPKQKLCEDEGCDHHGQPHVCVTGEAAVQPVAPEETLPKLENCGSYFAKDNAGQWHYLNHAGTWQSYQGPTGTFDNPELDGTEGAHPAWWRGNDHGVKNACERIKQWLTRARREDVLSGSYNEPLEEIRQHIVDLRYRAKTLNAPAARVIDNHRHWQKVRVTETADGLAINADDAHALGLEDDKLYPGRYDGEGQYWIYLGGN